MNKLLVAMMAAAMATASIGQENRRCEPTPDTSNIGGGYHHEGIYSQPKKLKKGAGHKKLTRAQRKKMNYYETKRR